MGRTRSSGWGTWFALVSLLASASAGQPARPEPRPRAAGEPAALTRPVAKGSFEVAYPEAETREATVELELVVDRQGRVAEVKIVEGAPPFAEAAAAAAKAFEFEPARRDGEPVVARIRIQVRFVPPEPKPEPEAEPAGAAAPSATVPAAKSEPRVEIVIEGERPPPGRMSLGRAEVRELPGAFGDPFRAVEVFPGVTPVFTGIPFFYVRGSPPGNVGYFLDGVRVPLLFHVALGPSVIHPGLVDHVDIYPGGYPARYGRFGGAVVAAETTAPRNELRGEANVRLFDAGALVEAPFADGRGNALVGGRYSYTAAMLSLFAPEVTLAYWDYQARLSYELGAKWRVGALVFGAYDLFRSDDDDASVGTQFHRVDVRADHAPDADTKLRIAASAGMDRSAAQENESMDDTDQPMLEDQMVAARFELERRLHQQLLLRAGVDVNFDRYRIVDVAEDDTDGAGELFYSRTDFTTGIRADVVWRPVPGITVTPGARADLYWSGTHGALAIEPRIAAEFLVGRGVALEHTFGVAHQAPSFVVPIPGFLLSDLQDGLQRSLQSSAGIVVRPGDGFQLGLSLFHNVFLNLTDFLGTLSLREEAFDDEEDEDRLDTRSTGQAYGLEILVKRPFSKSFSGYLAYTLSRSTRSLGGRTGPANFDRTHVVHAAASYALGRNWRAGARFSAYTGVPAQREVKFGSDPVREALEAVAVPASRRGPAYYRLDLRLEKRWLIDRRGRYWSFVMEMLNSTLNKEVPFLTCSASGCEGEAIGPVTIPSIGVEVFF